MENITLYVGLVLYNEKRFEFAEYNCEILPNGMYKLPDKLALPKDREHMTTAIHPRILDKRIYLDKAKNVNFIFYSLDKNATLFELVKSKEDFIKLQDSLIEIRLKEIAEIQKQINKYAKRKDQIEQDFNIKPVDIIRYTIE